MCDVPTRHNSAEQELWRPAVREQRAAWKARVLPRSSGGRESVTRLLGLRMHGVGQGFRAVANRVRPPLVTSLATANTHPAGRTPRTPTRTISTCSTRHP